MTARIQILIPLFVILTSCGANGQNKNTVDDTTYKHTNELINESSPYLLQHAHNPVNWMPWGDAAFEKAQKEDKLVLVSIGYSTCHWCHVMEHESFENEEVAKIMNDHFICIKVDREERPDVDQVYMSAVQLMTGQGGWPLNCFTLPDGRPIYGGTYFPKNKWVDILKQLHEAYADNPQSMREYAEKLTEGVVATELISVKSEVPQFTSERLDEMVNNWKVQFDNFRGGPNRAPKFPLPNNYEFLMHYAYSFKDTAVMEHVDLTLEKMAMGGIYDQIGGGFARYSTDTEWKVPHFEKMLYDNAQLVSLYCHAYQRTKKPLYKEVVYQTLGWVEREMTSSEGAFYSALDADSEGEEGKFYVWTKEELKTICGDDFDLVQSYYNIKETAKWEGNYILHRKQTDAAIADEFEMDLSALKKKIQDINELLLSKRSNRVRPGLDDKSITSWNCMMTIAYLDAYQVFGEQKFLDAAQKNMKWFAQNQWDDETEVYRIYKDGTTKINGFLEDYAYAIEMIIKYYEVTFNDEYLQAASNLLKSANTKFYDEASGMFYFSSDKDLIAQKMEIADNVIPSSNSIMARNLWKLGSFYDDSSYKAMSTQMLANVYGDMAGYGPGYSNWGILVLNMVQPYYEVAVTGPEWDKKLAELNQWYIPNKILMGGNKNDQSLPLLEGKIGEKTTIYVCVDKSCKMPVDNVPDAVAQMKR